jgi:hypothetical protein
LSDGTIQGKNQGGVVGYRGPGAPAAGPQHHYTWELFALDTKLDLGPDATRPDGLKAMDGHILGKADVARSATTSVALDRSWLFTTTSDHLMRTDLNGAGERTWQLIDEGVPEPTLAGVSGDLAVYVSGVAVHVLRLSTGRDVVLKLPSLGTDTDAELTQTGLFYAYNGAYTSRPGRVGFVTLRDLSAAVSEHKIVRSRRSAWRGLLPERRAGVPRELIRPGGGQTARAASFATRT